jgi:hypothetical protein
MGLKKLTDKERIELSRSGSCFGCRKRGHRVTECPEQRVVVKREQVSEIVEAESDSKYSYSRSHPRRLSLSLLELGFKKNPSSA